MILGRLGAVPRGNIGMEPETTAPIAVDNGSNPQLYELYAVTLDTAPELCGQAVRRGISRPRRPWTAVATGAAGSIQALGDRCSGLA